MLPFSWVDTHAAKLDETDHISRLSTISDRKTNISYIEVSFDFQKMHSDFAVYTDHWLLEERENAVFLKSGFKTRNL